MHTTMQGQIKGLLLEIPLNALEFRIFQPWIKHQSMYHRAAA